MKPPVVIHIKSAAYIKRALTAPPDPIVERIPKTKPNAINVAFMWLGSRLEDKGEAGYFLDGVPAKLLEIMRATNRVLKSQGIEQLAHNSDWLIVDDDQT